MVQLGSCGLEVIHFQGQEQLEYDRMPQVYCEILLGKYGLSAEIHHSRLLYARNSKTKVEYPLVVFCPCLFRLCSTIIGSPRVFRLLFVCGKLGSSTSPYLLSFSVHSSSRRIINCCIGSRTTYSSSPWCFVALNGPYPTLRYPRILPFGRIFYRSLFSPRLTDSGRISAVIMAIKVLVFSC